ncbi:MAG: Hsp20/alpha crystallin family protein [Spirochaetaceae bacterium]|nr:Hsp20/alpha crystallin family protein [Spirochaetaceae bacterium]MDT8297845.1 Hsp20/alpha crystallin family protein [Spirochaetaceae bacterium]
MDLMKWKDRPSQDSWNNLRSLQKEINALFEDDFFPASAGLFDRTFSPAVDLVEQADNYLVSCELPGMENSDIDVQVADNVLTIKGEKKSESEKGEKNWFKRETLYGRFHRTLPLPTGVDIEGIKGELENGVLRLNLPKKEEAKPKQISVKVK